MVWRIEVRKRTADPEAARVEAEANELGLRGIGPVRIGRTCYLEGELSRAQAEAVARELLTDPVCETFTLSGGGAGAGQGAESGRGLEVLYNPGVMDPSVAAIERALADMGLTGCGVSTGKAFRFGRRLDEGERNLLVRGVLANPLIQHVVEPGSGLPRARSQPARRRSVRRVPITRAGVEELDRVSREGMLALSREEMRALQRYFRRQGREPTDVELETFAQTWSEHCQHKTFRGDIEWRSSVQRPDGRRIRNLLKSTIFRVTEELKPPWVLSAFHDNSGVVEFDDEFGVCFKVETHNHPSALEPYGGAATGIGGVIRDCLGTGLGAKPVLNTDVFCFAHIGTSPEEVPEGVLHPRRVMRGVVAGVRDYGNRMGIPTANGAVYFDQGFMGNPLVFCGTVGLIPRSKLEKRVRVGQVIVLAGGRTGRDGIHGVTFASLELGQDAEMSSGAVQIGNPIEEKKLADVVLAARDRNLFSAITDCGGGGLSSAVGELAAGHGCEVRLDRVPLKYPGLTPAEIWISEAQERMIMFVEPGRVKELLALAAEHDVEATAIGRVTGTKRLVLKYRGRVVADIGMRFLHRGWRAVRRVATWARPDVSEPVVRRDEDPGEMLMKLLESPNIASKEWVTRQYDHEVQAGSVVKPFCGVNNAGPTDACVVRPLAGSSRACVVACGLRPRYGLVDPYWMAASAIDEALRNCVAVGGDIERTALLDNFCWGSPERPEQLGGLVRAAEACYEIARAYRVPFISGKDSLYNEFRNEQGDSLPIPPTLLVSALSVIDDGDRVVTMDLKAPGSLVYVVGETFEELGGSEFFRLHQGLGRSVPKVDARRGRWLLRAVGRAIRAGLVLACHDASEGGLGVALAEMGFAGGLGLRISLRRVPGARRFQRDDFLLFSESNTRLVCEVPVRLRARFERALAGIPHAVVGRTTAEPLLVASGLAGNEILRVELTEAERRWRSALTRRL